MVNGGAGGGDSVPGHLPDEGAAPTSRPRFRPSTPQDAPQIVALIASAGLNPNVRPQDLQWKYWQDRADSPGPRSFVLCDGSRIIAHGSAIPGSIAWEDQRARIVQVVDWAALPEAAGAGLSLMRHVCRTADIAVSIGGSQTTRRIMPLIGFRPHGEITGFVRPLRPLRIMRGGTRGGWRVLPRVLRSVLWASRAPRAEAGQWEVRRIGVEQLHCLGPVLPRPTGGMAVAERSEASLRHILACPIVPAELHALVAAGTVRGYFLLTFAPGQARLADLCIDTDDPADWRALILCAVRQARQHPQVAEIAAWASTGDLAERLRECGFHPRNTHPVQLMVRGRFNVPARLRLQMIETDAAYLHHGQPDLWS